MKKIIKNILYVLAMFTIFAACDEDPIDPLTGKYPVAEEYNLTSLSNSSVVKLDNGMRLFTVVLTGGSATLSVDFVGSNYFLATGAYEVAATRAATANTYTGTFNSQTITRGQLSVTKNGDNYTITGSRLTLSNNEVVRFSWAGTIIYEADPEPLALTKVLAASATAQENGTNLITLKLGTSGIIVTPGDYGDTYTGDGNYLSVDFISNDATLAAGTYTPAANEAAGDGNYVQGYDTQLDFGWGPMDFFNWGTCWFEVVNSVNTGSHITTGDITVAKSGATYTIIINNGDVYAQYTGPIEALQDTGGGGEEDDAIVLTNLFSASVNEKTLTLKIATDGITPTYVAEYFSWMYAGSGNYISIDLYTADGTLATGTYTPADSAAMGEFNFSKGYDTEMWGMQFFNWGTCWFTVTDGTESGVHLEEGTIVVEDDDADGIYTITGNFGDVKVKYTGEVTIG